MVPDLLDSAGDDPIRRARNGDRKAVEALLEKHMAAVYRLVALKLGPMNPALEDVVQEALIGAMGSMSRFKGDDEPTFLRWLLTIARYKVADHHRATFARRDAGDSDAAEPTSALGPAPDEIAAGRERQTVMRAALSALTPEQEEVITLKYLLGYRNEEVAAITNRTIGAVKALQHRGLASLARLLGAEVRE